MHGTETLPGALCRPSNTLPPFQITNRDVDILHLIAKHRFLNSDHIRRLIGGSPKNVTNRLKVMFEHGLLDRPECQRLYFQPGGGSRHFVYAVTSKGAKLVSGVQVHITQTVGYPYLEHTLAIADFAVALEEATRGSINLDLMDGDDLVTRLPEETRRKVKPFRMSTPIVHQGMRTAVGVEPDFVFSLRLQNEKQQAYFMVEIDRGTMPVERSNLKQTSILRKLLAYQTIWQSRLHQQQFAWHNFRVLFVTNSHDRARNMVAAANKQLLTKGSPIFLFTDKQSLHSPGSLLDHEWLGCDGKGQRLLPAGVEL